MFQKLLRWLRAQIGTLFGDASGANDIILSGQMENALALWAQMYETGGPWCTAKNDLHSLHIAASVAREFARLVTMELKVSLSGSSRADYLAEQLAPLSGQAAQLHRDCLRTGRGSVQALCFR